MSPPVHLPTILGLCLDCNYPLMDLPPHRCAECGRPFDPKDTETLNTGRPVPPYAAWAVGPISWQVTAVALLGCGVTLWRARLPRQPFTWGSPIVWGWMTLAGIWLAWPLVRWLTLRSFGWPDRVIRPTRRLHWVVPAVILAMAVGIARREVPRAAFAASRPAMDRLAHDVMAHPTDTFAPRWVGLFWAKSIRVVPGRDGPVGVSFVAEDRDVRSARVGFAYLLPDASPRGLPFTSYRPIGHGWWDGRGG